MARSSTSPGVFGSVTISGTPREVFLYHKGLIFFDVFLRIRRPVRGKGKGEGIWMRVVVLGTTVYLSVSFRITYSTAEDFPRRASHLQIIYRSSQSRRPWPLKNWPNKFGDKIADISVRHVFQLFVG